MPEYKEIFDRRGQLYHQAMETYPDSRSAEFHEVIAAGDISSGMVVVDVPSGGAYLADYLPPVNLISLETSLAFAELASSRTDSVLLFDNNTFPLATDSVDRVLSLAGLHHVEDKEPFFRECRRVLDAEGRLVVADVPESSQVQHFLDDFVGEYTETGHSGWYFGDTTRKELHNAGFEIVQDRILQYQWVAENKLQLADFCRTLFGMEGIDNARVIDEIGHYLGYRETPDAVGLNWQLQCFVCIADATSG